MRMGSNGGRRKSRIGRRLCLAGFGLGLMLCSAGCQRDYYEKGQPIQMSTSKLPGYGNERIRLLAEDNYQRFMHASYICLTDKFGNFHKIKISADIPRHNWDFSNLETIGNVKTYTGDPNVAAKVGIDVSEHQGGIDWKQVSGAVDFAMIRLGYRGYTGGSIALDRYYGANMAAAAANQVPVGVYFYSQATSYEEGVQEANFVLANLGAYSLAYPIVLDREDPMQEDARTNDLSREEHTQAALGFLETIHNAGYPVMTYTNRNYFALYLDLDQICKYPTWLAQYADEPDWPYEFSIWQYTESGTIPGISGPVDLNLQMMPF